MLHRKNLAKVGVAAVAVLLCLAAPARAAADYYAAIAFSPSTGDYGYSWNASSRAEAEEAALGRVTAGDARVVGWSRNAYLALAIGDGRGWGCTWGNTEEEAQQNALALCNSYTTNGRIVVVVFSGR